MNLWTKRCKTLWWQASDSQGENRLRVPGKERSQEDGQLPTDLSGRRWQIRCYSAGLVLLSSRRQSYPKRSSLFLKGAILLRCILIITDNKFIIILWKISFILSLLTACIFCLLAMYPFFAQRKECLPQSLKRASFTLTIKLYLNEYILLNHKTGKRSSVFFFYFLLGLKIMSKLHSNNNNCFDFHL